ncbi:MAG: MarC family protein [Panacagrimonas sp.]
MTVTSAAVSLFLVLDPLGNILLVLSALRRVPAKRQRRVILRELLIALGALLGFLLMGGQLMRLLGLSQQALSLAGGFILMLIALRMVFPTHDHSLEEELDSEPFIVPVAIPYIAGPSSLATVLLMMSREPARWMEWIAAVLLAWAACVPILLSAGRLHQWLGRRGLIAFERLMGLVLVTIAVEMMLAVVTDIMHRPG